MIHTSCRAVAQEDDSWPLLVTSAWSELAFKPGGLEDGEGLRMVMPRHQLPEDELHWRVPRTLNAMERNRARAYAMAVREVSSCGCTLD